jgi:hypothetical protein
MNLALETEEFFILSFDDTQKKSNIKCHDIYRFFFVNVYFREKDIISIRNALFV